MEIPISGSGENGLRKQGSALETGLMSRYKKKG